jgi:hypothetical protein
MAKSKTTTDHKEIQQWAERRGGKPACVLGTGGGGDAGILRIDFPGYSGEGSLHEIEWDEFFAKFDAQNLALVYQDTTADGEPSNFNKLVSRDSASGGGSGGKRAAGGKKKSAAPKKAAAATKTAKSANRKTASKGKSAPKKAPPTKAAKSAPKKAVKTAAKKAPKKASKQSTGGVKKAPKKAAKKAATKKAAKKR